MVVASSRNDPKLAFTALHNMNRCVPTSTHLHETPLLSFFSSKRISECICPRTGQCSVAAMRCRRYRSLSVGAGSTIAVHPLLLKQECFSDKFTFLPDIMEGSKSSVQDVDLGRGEDGLSTNLENWNNRMVCTSNSRR